MRTIRYRMFGLNLSVGLILISGVSIAYTSIFSDSITSRPKIFGRFHSDSAQISSIEYNFGYYMLRAGNENAVFKEKTVLDKEGNFYIPVPDIKVPERLTSFSFRIGSRWFVFENYVVEPNDSIFITINECAGRPALFFSGRGYEKFQCRYEIEAVKGKYGELIEKYKTGKGNISQWSTSQVKSYLHIYAGRMREMLTVLESHSQFISKLAYEYMKADIFTYDINRLQFMSSVFLESRNENVKSTLKKEYYSEDEVLGFVLGSNTGLRSPYFLRYFTSKLVLEIMFRNGNATFAEVYDELNRRLTGQNLESAIFGLITMPSIINSNINFKALSSSDRVKILSAAISLIKDSVIKKNLERFSLTFFKGRAGYEFSLEDTSGNKIDFSSFRGKYVILDFFYTGCGGCILASKNIEKYIKPAYSRGDIVYVTISADKEKSVWVNSIRKEVYSKKGDINLYTGGKGYGHEIFEYYGIRQFPYIIVLDREGKIITNVLNPNVEKLTYAIFSSIPK